MLVARVNDENVYKRDISAIFAKFDVISRNNVTFSKITFNKKKLTLA